jgi:phage gp45-like
MMRKILNMMRQGFVSLISNDSEPYPIAQATVNGKPTQFTRLSIYGICSNPPKNSHVFLMSSQGQEAVKFGVLNDFLNRKKNLKEGEVAIINTKTGAFILLKENGDIDIESANTNYTGNIKIVGDLDVDGDIAATGDITVDGDIIVGSSSISFLNHIHSQPNDSNGDTEFDTLLPKN